MATPEQTTKTAKIGMIGLGVMGENLARNIERNGYSIAVWNREPAKVDEFTKRLEGHQVIGAKTPEEFVKALERPRKMILLVKAGDPVDWTVDQVKPFLEEGDIIIDGGNSYFMDTERREKALKAEGLNFIGSGVSGGEKGALWGPSLMPGGDRQAYEQIRPIWEAIAAKVDDGPCVTYIGPGGAGHFVKMVHNGIEYGLTQAYAEGFDILKGKASERLAEDERFEINLADVAEVWRRGSVISSWLLDLCVSDLAEDHSSHRVLGKSLRLWRRSSVDDRCRDGGSGARLRSFCRAVRSLSQPSRYNLWRQAAVGDALRLWWPCRDAAIGDAFGLSVANTLHVIHQQCLFIFHVVQENPENGARGEHPYRPGMLVYNRNVFQASLLHPRRNVLQQVSRPTEHNVTGHHQ